MHHRIAEEETTGGCRNADERLDALGRELSLLRRVLHGGVERGRIDTPERAPEEPDGNRDRERDPEPAENSRHHQTSVLCTGVSPADTRSNESTVIR